MASVREPALCYGDEEFVVDPEAASFSVMDSADSVVYEYLHDPWELQLPAGVVLGAEPGNASAFAHDGGWAANTGMGMAGVSSSSSTSSSSPPVTFDVHGRERSATWVDNSADYGDALAPRRATSNFLSFEGGSGVDAKAAASKRPRAHAPSQHGARQEEAVTVAKKQRGSRTKQNATPPNNNEPQKSAAKNRRERVNERLKVLQELVPNGRKVDTVTMLDKAITYVKFMQLQLKVLETDAFWPTQGGKAPEMSQVKEALDSILLSALTSSQCTHPLI